MLFNTDGRPVAVVEAKREGIDPLAAKEQARAYAESLNVAGGVFEQNGLLCSVSGVRELSTLS